MKKPRKSSDLPDAPGRKSGGQPLDHLKEPFLAALRVHHFVTQACEAVPVGRSTVYDWRERDPDFKKAMDDVDAELIDRLRHEAYERATKGTSGRPPSDFLLEKLLRARDPAFRENARIDVHINFLEMVVVKLQDIVQRFVPIKCAHCGHALPTRKDLARELEGLTLDTNLVHNEG